MKLATRDGQYAIGRGVSSPSSRTSSTTPITSRPDAFESVTDPLPNAAAGEPQCSIAAMTESG